MMDFSITSTQNNTCLCTNKRMNCPKLNLLFLGCAYIFMFTNPDKYFFVSHYYVFFVLSILTAIIQLVYVRKFSVDFSTKVTLFLIIDCFFACVFTGNLLSSGVALSYMLMYLLLFTVLFFRYTKSEIRILINCIILGGVIISLLVLIYRVDYYGASGRYTIKINGNPKIDPNYLGAFLAISLVCSLVYCIYSKRRMIIIWIVAILIILATLMTGSRAAMLASAISVGFVLIQYIYDEKKTLNYILKIVFTLILATIIVSVLLSFLPPELYARYFTSSYVDPSNLSRLDHWENALPAIFHSPWFGYGLAEDGEILQKFSGAYFVAHNTLLVITLQLGLFGLVPFILLVLNQIIQAWKNCNFILLGLLLNVIVTSMPITAIYTFTLWGTLILSIIINRYYKEHNLKGSVVFAS